MDFIGRPLVVDLAALGEDAKRSGNALRPSDHFLAGSRSLGVNRGAIKVTGSLGRKDICRLFVFCCVPIRATRPFVHCIYGRNHCY